MYLDYTKDKWTNEVLEEEVIHVNENETTSLKKTNWHWNIFFIISLFNHLYDKTARSKKLDIVFLVFLESSWQGGEHWLGSILIDTNNQNCRRNDGRVRRLTVSPL